VKAKGEFSGKFGYEYPVASAILDGEVVKKTFSDTAFNRAELKGQLEKFRTIEDPASSEMGALGVLVIEAKGRTIEQPIEIPLGDAKRPIPPSQVVDKYVRNASEVVGADVAKHTAQMLLSIETLTSIRPVLNLLAKRG
jgi:2-methylcitrate dehydratase PrpD